MRILVIRLGAFGDMLITTPLLRYLKSEGHEIYLNTSAAGVEVMKNNPNVDKIIFHEKDSVDDEKLDEHWAELAKEYACDKTINLCESIERRLSCHLIDPMYNLTKQERKERCNKNFYEYAFEHAGYPIPEGLSLRPELFPDEAEEQKMRNFFDPKYTWILWGLSGSGNNKTYPWVDYILGDVLKKHIDDVRVVTVGDELCQILECVDDKRVIRKSGKWSMRESMIACKFADIVVAPDTGILHASGCFDTMKIGIIGSNTIENITKHFTNDMSMEAQGLACAPCFRLIYSSALQCPIDKVHGLPLCMVEGLDPKEVLQRIEYAIRECSEM